jgi:hypothetical protein
MATTAAIAIAATTRVAAGLGSLEGLTWSRLDRFRKRLIRWWHKSVVPEDVEARVAMEIGGPDDVEVTEVHHGGAFEPDAHHLFGAEKPGIVMADGDGVKTVHTQRIGVALRLAKEVKLRFGGTPKLSEANRLLAARYIDEALTEHGVTRKIDRAKLMYKIRALVFTRLQEEQEEDQWLNSEAAQGSHDKGTGWRSHNPLTWWGVRRRVPAQT